LILQSTHILKMGIFFQIAHQYLVVSSQHNFDGFNQPGNISS
jgi:hypothetical protein